MKSPYRIPVKAEQVLMNVIAMCWPQIQNQDIRFHLNVLAEQLQGELDRKLGRKQTKEKRNLEIENTEGEDIRKFIALFQDRYVQETDMEYRTKLNPDEIGIMKSLVKKLRDKKVSIDDYLNWVFDVFYDDPDNREKFSPPMIKLICGTFLASKFFMNNRDKLRSQIVVEEKKSRRDSIRDYGKTLFRTTKDPTIQKMLENEYKGSVTTEYLETFLKKKEIELKGETSNGQ